jgi:hypothetical protein
VKGTSVLRGLGLVLGSVVLVVAGAYLLIYLYRWEWNRAIVSGLFFLSALVTLSTMVILRSLRTMAERLDQLEAAATREQATRRLIAGLNADRARRHFAWLSDRSSQLSVFIPVLIGAGALLSGVTYLLERVASALAGTTIDRRTARLLAPDLPLGPARTPTRTLRAAAVPPATDPLVPPRRPPETARRRSARWLAVVLAVTALVGVALVLRSSTQSRPEPGSEQGSTALVLRIDQQRTPRPVDEVAEALWIACRARLTRTTDLTAVRLRSDGTVEMVVDQGMGPLRERRFVGCLEDATLDLVSAEVIATRRVR